MRCFLLLAFGRTSRAPSRHEKDDQKVGSQVRGVGGETHGANDNFFSKTSLTYTLITNDVRGEIRVYFFCLIS